LIQTAQPSWQELIPKIELHLHLEGAIPYDAMWALVEKYGPASELPDLPALIEKFTFRDFPHFIETWIWKNQYIRSLEDFTFIAESVARSLLAQNILYAEIFYSPSDFAAMNLAPQPLTVAIREGFNRVQGVEIALIADLVRDSLPEDAARTLTAINEVRDQGVIGIGLGGSEQKFPAELFTKVFEQARQLGFHTTVHAGEAAGAESIWSALRNLRPERIGHGTRAVEDSALIGYLADNRIPVEMCPLSNLKTGVIDALGNHPIRQFFERGLLVSVNTDDPMMFGNSLAEEFHQLEARLGFTPSEIQSLIGNAIQSSWLPAERKSTFEHKMLSDQT
jgi:adenosine deaminase